MKPLRKIREFPKSEDGVIIVFVAIALSAMLGMAALAFDIGRVTTTQADLQTFADNVALAAAGELDGETDSITRATNAAANMISDEQSFGLRNKDAVLSGTSDYTLTFYSRPTNPDAAIAQPSQLLDPSVASSGTRAAFVRVIIDNHEVATPLAAAAAALVGNSQEFSTVNAEAVAGFTLMACDITPMFFCLPEPSLDVSEGQMIKMVSQGGGASSQWGPGNFGFLAAGGAVGIDPDGACDPAPPGQEDSCALAASKAVSLCFAQTLVETQPGLSVGNMIAGFATRFDQYNSSSKQYTNDKKYDVDNFAGAPNVLDGWITEQSGNQCSVTQSPAPYDTDGNLVPEATVGLPLDTCLETDSCTNGRIGDGTFTYDDYLTVNFGYDPLATPPVPAPTWFDTSDTRYETYLKEIANADTPEFASYFTGKLEQPGPACQAPSSSAAADPRRRVIIAAGVDCKTYQAELKGGSGAFPVERFVEIFLVRPPESDGTGANAVIYGEVIRDVSSGEPLGEGGILHDLVQIYE